MIHSRPTRYPLFAIRLLPPVSLTPIADRVVDATLPDVPGGWKRSRLIVGDRVLTFLHPRSPDDFLEDERVLAANALDDYMPYWATIWPASYRFASALFAADWPPGSEVWELGSGTGIVGLAACLRGWNITFTDYDQQALDLCLRNARDNGFHSAKARLLDWRHPAPCRVRFVIGCEVTYDAASHPVLLRLLSELLTDDGVCWLADPGRSQARPFYELAIAAGYLVSVRDETASPAPFHDDGRFQIFELQRSLG
jgi:predicted nicotinamide N-methyase